MTTYNIYGPVNGADDSPVLATITLNDDDSEIVSVTSDRPDVQAEVESVLREYVEGGFSALDAITRYAGAYGDVEEVNPDGSLVAVATDEPAPGADEAAATPVVPTSPIDNGVMAMTDDDGVVITLYQSDPEHGAVLRHDGEWIPLVDPATLNDLAFVGVQDSAVALYDQHEADKNLLPIKFYTPSADGPYWPIAIPLNDDELVNKDDVDEEGEDEEPLAASVTLDSADDLDAAIAAAAADPDLQWYVERRVAALELEAVLPWQKD